MYRPLFSISNQLLNTIAQIESLLTQARHLPVFPAQSVDLRYRATVEQTFHSTSIEGNPLSLQEVETALAGQPLSREEYAVLEVRNYKKALDYIAHRQMGLLGSADLKLLQRIAMSGLLPEHKTGVWRSGDIFIVDQDQRVKYQGPSAMLVEQLTDELFTWLNEHEPYLHPCIGAAILHYQLVTIHPFADGNGRSARLAVMLYLALRDYDFDACLVLETFYASDKAKYYAALHRCQGKVYNEAADISSWIDYFCAGFLSAAKVLVAELRLTALLSPAATKRRLSKEEQDLLSWVRAHGELTVNDAMKLLSDTPRRTVQRRLKQLVDDGLLEVSGSGKRTAYRLRITDDRNQKVYGV